MVPWANQGFERDPHMREHARNAIAVAIEKSANEEDWNLNRVVIGVKRGTPPKLGIVLMVQVEHEPRRIIEAFAQRIFV